MLKKDYVKKKLMHILLTNNVQGLKKKKNLVSAYDFLGIDFPAGISQHNH